jgi:hypothetical protein
LKNPNSSSGDDPSGAYGASGGFTSGDLFTKKYSPLLSLTDLVQQFEDARSAVLTGGDLAATLPYNVTVLKRTARQHPDIVAQTSLMCLLDIVKRAWWEICVKGAGNDGGRQSLGGGKIRLKF